MLYRWLHLGRKIEPTPAIVRIIAASLFSQNQGFDLVVVIDQPSYMFLALARDETHNGGGCWKQNGPQ